MVERMRQFDAAARYPGVIAPADLDLGLRGDLVAGFGDAPLPRIDVARKDQRLRALPRFCQAAFDEELIGAALGDRV